MKRVATSGTEKYRSTTPSEEGVVSSSCVLSSHVSTKEDSEPQASIPDPFAAVEAAWTPSQFKPKNFDEALDMAGKSANTSATAAQRKKQVREYTLGEEVANSISHGVGALLAIASFPILIVLALGDGAGIYLFAVLVYCITMLLEYTMSTLYHAISAERAKKVFKILDHSCIYLFIAGTYTPFCLISLADHGGMWLCVFVWAIAFIGVALEAFWVFRPRWISALLYLLMGWCIVWFGPALLAALPTGGLWLLVAGGLCYTVGCVFYVLKKIPYMHSIFHLWVLAGSVCHFLAIALYIM